MGRFYSAIIPLYNRPDEIDELLESLTHQSYTHFEVVVIEDGSSDDAKAIVESYSNQLTIQYHYKENEGQGFARNYAFEKAKGEYFVILDSDAVIPPQYFEEVEKALNANYVDLFGGPDAAQDSFTDLQKAISYSMTSLFTTGGIRGNKKHVGTFHPRSFNMGVSRKAWEKVGGFAITRMGEDIEYSIRIIKAGFKSALIPKAFIYHKRRTSLHQFYRQLHFFGRARINISRFYPDQLKLIHTFPMGFVMAFTISFLLLFFTHHLGRLAMAFFVLYYLAIAIDSTLKNKSAKIGLLSVATSFTQLWAYGIGFISEGWVKLTKG